ncbi:DUF5689 domain-containing protein [Pedobacter psychrophilus]|nr:DUF5689 domain-containing protein [Pedobacter psychrophilus]
MKLKYLIILLFASSFVLSACEKHDFAAGVVSSITSVEDVRDLYKGTEVTITSESLLGAEKIRGVVISNPDSANIASGLVVIQNTTRNKTRGIILAVENANTYKMGDSLLVNISGGKLNKVNGSMQITGLKEANITKTSSGSIIQPQSTSTFNINAKPGDYESTLVQIKGGTVNPPPTPTSVFNGEKSIINGADSIILHTETAASFANAQLPATADFAGILFVKQDANSNTILQIWPRTEADITNRIAPTDPNGPKLGKFPVIITGFVNDAKGADGNYEYFQFRATRDIDFEKTPMAVVTCTNAGSAAPYAGTAPEGGWATGGGRSYKFNLTSGKVLKGEYFYVGGGSKRINGPNSTLISDAKWITAINYVTIDGDGFGSKSSGLLPNSGNAGGISIFEGTNVTETSIPVDVVFFGGTGKTTMFNETGPFGYRVTDSDHYTITDPATKVDQPFFYQGTNQYVIPHKTPADLGIFVKLGGVFDAKTKTWTTARGYEFYEMTQTSAISEIETTGATTINN